MSLSQLLFLVRLFSALLLLSFAGLIAYYLYRDALLVRSRTEVGRQLGTLRVTLSHDGQPPVDTLFPLNNLCTIGRGARNTIILDDAYVSQEHARLLRREGHWWLNDLGSRNGTLLNAVPLTTETVVTAGDEITIGRTTFKLESESE